MARYKPYEIELLAPFRFWCQKVLPAVYDDSLSYYELLCKVLHWLNKDVIPTLNEHTEAITELASELTELKEAFDKFQESGFDDYYREQVQKWIDEHLRFIFNHITSTVFFGLTDDGYFCAYIPRSWASIIFDTIVDYNDDNYGCLLLNY
jgi:hypothetical protein